MSGFGSGSFGRIGFGSDASNKYIPGVSCSLASRSRYSSHLTEEIHSRATYVEQLRFAMPSRANLCSRIQSVFGSRASMAARPVVEVSLPSRATVYNRMTSTLWSTAESTLLPGFNSPLVPLGADGHDYEWPEEKVENPSDGYIANYRAHPAELALTLAERMYVEFYYIDDTSNNTVGPIQGIGINSFSFTTKVNGGWNFNFSCNGDGILEVVKPEQVRPEYRLVAKIIVDTECVKTKGALDLQTGEFEYETYWRRHEWFTPQFVVIQKDVSLSDNSYSTSYSAVDIVTYLLTQNGVDFPTFRKINNISELTEFSLEKDWNSEDIISKYLTRARYVPFPEEVYNQMLNGAAPGRQATVPRGFIEYFPQNLQIEFSGAPSYPLVEFDARGGNAMEHIGKLLQATAFQFVITNRISPQIVAFRMKTGSGAAHDVSQMRVTSISEQHDSSAYKGGFHSIKGSKINSRFEFVFTTAGFHKVTLGNDLKNASYYVQNSGGYIDLVSSFDGPDSESSGYNGTTVFNKKNSAKIINVEKRGNGDTRSLTLAVYPPENPPFDAPIYCRLVVEGIPVDKISSGFDLKWSHYYPSQNAGRPLRNPIDLSLLPTARFAQELYPEIMADLNKGFHTIQLNTGYPYHYITPGSTFKNISKFIPSETGDWRVESVSFKMSESSVSTNFNLVKMQAS